MTTSIQSESQAFNVLLTPQTKITELVSNAEGKQFAHEAGIWLPKTREVVYTSNQSFDQEGVRTIEIGVLNVDTNEIRTITPSPQIYMANGGTNYMGKSLICEQGTSSASCGLTLLDTATGKSEKLIETFHGTQFNSPNDVVVHKDGTIWFTDPNIGFLQGFRPKQNMPCQVFCFHPKTGEIRAVSDDIDQPNGIAFSPDYKQAYVTDTSAYGIQKGDGKTVPFTLSHLGDQKSSIYVYDVVPLPSGSQRGHTLANRRLFAFSNGPAPDGIKCDHLGNVWSGCHDGIRVWDQDGFYIGKFAIEGGIANFCFTDDGTVIALNEKKIYRIDNLAVHGALDVTL